ncbi:MAG TPA: phage tail tip lysozyme [Caulobacteraceae bacterium]|nr:phage tail tip lysozyme [Caulobacteraceae bacterium]
MANATVIDELVVTLGLDPKNFNDEQKKAMAALRQFQGEAEKSRRKAEQEGQRAAEGFFGRIKSEALGLFAVLAGANSIKDFVSKTVSGLTDVSVAAKAAGLSVRDLTMFGNAIEANGGKAEVAQQSLTNLAAALERWNTLGQVSPELVGAMQQIGGNRSDSPIEIFEKLSKFAETHDPRLTAQVGAQLGFDPKAIDLAMKGLAFTMDQFAEAKKRGLPDDADAQKVRQLQNAFRGLSQEIQAAGRGLLVDLAPGLTNVLNIAAGANDKLTHQQQDDKKNAWWKFFLFQGPEPTSGPGEPLRFGKGAAGGMDPVTPLSHDDLRAGVLGLAAGKPNAVGGGAGASKFNGRAAQAQAALVAAGFSADQAAGVVGWLFAEGGFNEKAFNSAGGGHGAFGIGQWRGDRQRRLFQMFGKNPTFDQQLQYLIWELGHTEQGAAGAIRGAGSAGDALWATATQFGRGSLKDNLSDLRRGSKFLGLSGGAQLAAAGGTVVTGNTTTVQIGAINVNAPNATDANGVARGIGGALKSTLTQQANSGLTG